MGKISKTAGPSNVGAGPVVDEPEPAAAEPVYDDPPEDAAVVEIEAEPSGGEDYEPASPPVRRPPVNAAKADHVNYGVTRYGLDAGYLDDEFNKADLIVALTALDDGEARVADGRIVPGPAAADPPGEGDANDAAADAGAETDDSDDSSDQGGGDTADTPA